MRGGGLLPPPYCSRRRICRLPSPTSAGLSLPQRPPSSQARAACKAEDKPGSGVSVPGHALRCGPETSVTKPLAVVMVRVEGAQENIYPVVEVVGMWKSRRDFQREWKGWE